MCVCVNIYIDRSFARMASFFGDLTANANCGTANPIAQALSSQMNMSAQLADVKGMQKPMAPAGGGNVLPPQLLPTHKPNTAPVSGGLTACGWFCAAARISRLMRRIRSCVLMVAAGGECISAAV